LEVDTELILEGGVVVPVRLRIDRIDAEIADGYVVVTVIDYKTSSSGVPSKKRVDLGEFTQMPLYLAAVTSWFAERGMKVIAREAAYHTFGKSLRTVSDPVVKSMELDYDYILSKVEPAIATLSDGQFPVRPTEKACRYCGLNEICRIESWGPIEENTPV
jgi:ATP-dependent helicase/DNAse subunit B